MRKAYDEYWYKLMALYHVQEKRIPVTVRYDGEDITGYVTIVDVRDDTFTIEMPEEFDMEDLNINLVTEIDDDILPEFADGESVSIWVDDVRTAPDGYFWTKSVYETIALIEKAEKEGADIRLIDLDHDLGGFAQFGGDAIKILDYLVEKGRFYPVRLHTANPVGRQNMEREIRRYWPDGQQ